ncbi:aldolase/citrate lyase family protein [Ichthyenterobacterium sp. W332]|uniref:Aldolase/citrate lyase family protein n=1 Tax=Microcosmobacter mediterraneus TaxID=3075607 RepID=A0ABU2YLC6_9FLAO|nr:aldolase/citrate lyase family protein [Ichthyenterobacterium sp. W332]MDT0558055.1 aldolase/citrate lyase family protein [Ichthyenterobacterium sp. W332]
MKNFLHNNSALKSKLTKNELSIGSWLTIPHPAVVEIMSSANFEWLTIDIEHSAIDFETVQNLIGHIQANNMEALVRVSKNDEVIIKRVMDAGANGIVVPMVKNAEEAREAVSFVKYPPVGKRGVGLSRAQHYGVNFESYKKWVQKESIVIIQIEHIEAVNNLSEILDVEGVDGIIVGPYDLSASMGKPGMFNDEDVKEVLNRIDKITLSKNKPLGFHVISSDHQIMLEKINKKYTFLAFSLDFFFLGDKAREQMSFLKRN